MWASHCCGTTWPSGPTVSLTTRTQALYHLGASGQQARSWACGGVVAEGVHCAAATWVGAAPVGAKWQGQSKASSQCHLHGLRQQSGSCLPLAGPTASGAVLGHSATKLATKLATTLDRGSIRFESASHGTASRVATRPYLFRPPLARLGPPGPRATWGSRPAGSASAAARRHGARPPPSSRSTMYLSATRAVSRAWVPRRPPRRPNMPPALCAQPTVKPGHPARPGGDVPRAAFFLLAHPAQATTQRGPNGIIVHSGICCGLGRRQCPDSMVGAGDAHVNSSNHAHCKSGRCGRWSRICLSVRMRSSAYACTNAGCPSSVPRTKTPRWASGLSPCQTSPSNSAIPGGAGMASAAMARVLPRFEAIPQWAATVPATSSTAARAPAGLVMM